MRCRRFQASALVVAAIVLCALTEWALAQDAGSGAIVVGGTEREGNVSVYFGSEGGTVRAIAVNGDYVAGITEQNLLEHEYTFDNKSGRMHVVYFGNKEQVGIQHTGWIDSTNLEPFTYDCGCGLREFHGLKTEQCSPFAKAGGFLNVKRKWNDCFIQARDQKIAELKGGQRGGPGAEPAASSAASANSTSASDGADDKPLSADEILKATSAEPGTSDSPSSKPFTNKDVISLVKAGLGDKIVIDKVRSMPGDNLDTSTEALIHLKKAGVSKAVIEAMLKRTTAP